ncbi:hypothetical protein PUNSTDRAFT_137695 [Punctularia strigosozonata HHB-11173 SS5]|uniref:uncharacterized protein n=1 Tax=Punctularia strigosozonata (strain HHB-11173) TaxID=741275 RepID=UPI00044162AC|nr:uncharacterized protein PUNSTDRAFT_137695 [Punctularia strigosozonata HHB-11173 SS5]EIN05590.1 hypothetical protein PUNSTDRAFT_137695 [Punctularia strigosozonata HHB-11173 SS5]
MTPGSGPALPTNGVRTTHGTFCRTPPRPPPPSPSPEAQVPSPPHNSGSIFGTDRNVRVRVRLQTGGAQISPAGSTWTPRRVAMYNPWHPPPAPPAFGEDKVVPGERASLLSKLVFARLGPFLAVGFSRPL